ncbi:hypothetical protein Tco_1096277 [Tanacetum coccineum]
MSEAEPIPPTSSVTALRIPMIKKGEYDLWSMKMRQYIAITDHILWDIITVENPCHNANELYGCLNKKGFRETKHHKVDAKRILLKQKQFKRFYYTDLGKEIDSAYERFAKYQENRANGRTERKIVAIKDSNSKALVATDNNKDIDWTKEFDAEPVTFTMMALTGLEEDDWSMKIDSEPMHFGQDGFGDFD